MFYGFHDIRTEKDIEKVPFEGGGGTDFDVAVNAFSNRVDNRIVFTDGLAPMPNKKVRAIWLVYGDGSIKPDGGKVIHITPDKLEELNGRARILRR
jgi:predicted metal-dependent peptidase